MKGSMKAKHTISINGQLYDAVTGMRVAKSSIKKEATVNQLKKREAPKSPSVPRKPASHSTSVHQNLNKSNTLKRSHLTAPKKKPILEKATSQNPRITRSPMITRFATHPKPLPKSRPSKMINDIGPSVRQPAKTNATGPRPQTKPSSREIKENLIKNAGEEIDRALLANTKRSKPKRVPFMKKIDKRHIIATGLATLLIFGYVAYLSMPGFSVRLASAQAGVNAKYPDYNPDGYSFVGPVAFEQGKVEIHFKANGGGEGYTITQKNSSWNSTAVLDYLVSQDSNGKYDINSTSGITVYTYGTRAAWTNGGVLYTIDGKAPLSSDQLVHIASSM